MGDGDVGDALKEDLVPVLALAVGFLIEEGDVRGRVHGGGLVGESYSHGRFGGFETEEVEGCGTVHEIGDYLLGGGEGFAGVGGAVDGVENVARVAVVVEGGAVSKTVATDRAPDRAFNGTEVGNGEEESWDIGVVDALGPHGDVCGEGRVDGSHGDNIADVSWLSAGLGETVAATVEWVDLGRHLPLGEKIIPSPDSVRKLLNISSDENPHVVKAVELLPQLLKLFDSISWLILEEATETLEDNRFRENVASTLEGLAFVGYMLDNLRLESISAPPLLGQLGPELHNSDRKTFWLKYAFIEQSLQPPDDFLILFRLHLEGNLEILVKRELADSIVNGAALEFADDGFEGVEDALFDNAGVEEVFFVNGEEGKEGFVHGVGGDDERNLDEIGGNLLKVEMERNAFGFGVVGAREISKFREMLDSPLTTCHPASSPNPHARSSSR